MATIWSRTSSSSPMVTCRLCPGLQSVIDIIRSIYNTKSKPLLVFHFCKSSIWDKPRPCGCCINLSSCPTYRLKTLSGLRSRKRHDKNETAFEPIRGMIPLFLLNQATVLVSRSGIFPEVDDLVQFCRVHWKVHKVSWMERAYWREDAVAVYPSARLSFPGRRCSW